MIGSGSAGVGERVEADVDLVVQSEVRLHAAAGEKGKSFGGDAFCVELFRQRLPALIERYRRHDHDRVGQLTKQPAPQTDRERIDLAQAVEAAESDETRLERRQTVH